MAYELRRRGFNVEAKPNPYCKGTNVREADVLLNWTERFKNPDGSKVVYETSYNANVEDTVASKRKYIELHTLSTGRYEVYCAWKEGSAHVFITERTEQGNLIWFDPQNGKKGRTIEETVENMRPELISVIRIDNKIINPKFAERFLRVR